MRLTPPSLCRCPCAFNSEHTRLHQSLWEALRVYERCRRLLADELGAYPSPETEAVYLDLLRAEKAPDEPGDLGSPRPATSRLQRHRTALLIAVVRLLHRQTIRHAVNGVFGVAIGVAFAWKTGSAKDFYLPGIILSAVYGLVSWAR